VEKPAKAGFIHPSIAAALMAMRCAAILVLVLEA
jgi:hypothetical protein